MSPSALVQLGCTPKSARIAELEINNGRAPVCCKSGFNCMHRYYASSRSWSIQAFDNANHVGTTNSPTGQHSGTKDLTYREFCRLSGVSQLFLRFLSSSRSNGWNVAWSAVRRLHRSFLQFSCSQRDESEVPVPVNVSILVWIQGTQVSTQ